MGEYGLASIKAPQLIRPPCFQSELLRLSRTNFSEAYQILTHLKVVRVFVESVLRYGLPAEYSAIVVKVGLRGLQLVPPRPLR